MSTPQVFIHFLFQPHSIPSHEHLNLHISYNMDILMLIGMALPL